MTMSPEPTPATTSTDATLDRKRRPGLRRLLAYGAGALAAIGLVAFIVAGPGVVRARLHGLHVVLAAHAGSRRLKLGCLHRFTPGDPAARRARGGKTRPSISGAFEASMSTVVASPKAAVRRRAENRHIRRFSSSEGDLEPRRTHLRRLQVRAGGA